MYATRETGSGLVVAEEAMDEARVGRALKDVDRRLVLQKHRGEVPGGWVYKVICVVSDEHAPAILTWADRHGNPLPLASGIVDAVQRLRLDVAHRSDADVDEQNARAAAELERARANTDEAIADDHRPYVDRGRVSVGLSTKAAKPYWQRNHHLPEGLRR